MQSLSDETKMSENLQRITKRMYCIIQKIVLLVLLIQTPITLMIIVQFLRPYLTDAEFWFTWISTLHLILAVSSFCSLLMLEHNNKSFEFVAMKYLRWLECLFPHLFVLIDENVMELSIHSERSRNLDQDKDEAEDKNELKQTRLTRVSVVSVKVDRIETPQLDREDTDQDE